MAPRLFSLAALLFAGSLLFACGGSNNGGKTADAGRTIDAATGNDGGGTSGNDGGGTANDGGGTTANDGGAGGVDGAPVDCVTCAMNECATEYTACQGSSTNPCSCTLECINNGGSEGTCKKDCSSQQNQAWADLVTCLDQTTCYAGC